MCGGHTEPWFVARTYDGGNEIDKEMDTYKNDPLAIVFVGFNFFSYDSCLCRNILLQFVAAFYNNQGTLLDKPLNLRF